MKRKGIPRKAYSFERTLKDLADEIGYESISTVIDKKRKAVEHISNPTFKNRQLHIQDGLELDIHCKSLGKGTPFLNAYETLLKKELSGRKGHDSVEEINNNCLRLVEAIGDVFEQTRKALMDDKVDDKEKEGISVEVIKLEKKISELKLKLNLGNKTDYKSQKNRD